MGENQVEVSESSPPPHASYDSEPRAILHPKEVAETSVILTDLKEADVVIPFMSLLNSPVAAPAKTRWILNYDCRLLQAQLSSSPSQSTATMSDVFPKTDYCGLRDIA